MGVAFRILFRRARKHLGMVAAVIIAAAMPMSVNAALFAILDGLHYRDLPFERPEELVAVDYKRVAGQVPELAYLPALRTERDALRRRLEASPLVASASQVGFASFVGLDASTGLQATGVDSRFFRLLGLAPVLGRPFDLADERSPALLSGDSDMALPVIIGFHVWLRQFGGDPEVLGGTRSLGGRKVRIVGVMPAEVKFPNETNLWAPVSSERGRPPAIIRLAPSTTIESLSDRFPQLVFTPLRDSVRPGETGFVTLLFVAAALFVLVAWVQVAALVWSGTVGRLRELGINLALGATRLRLLASFWIEGATAASVVLLVVWLATPPITVVLVSVLPEALTSGQYLAPGLRTLAFGAGLAAVGLAVLSLVPLHLVRRASPIALLGGRVGSLSLGAAPVRNAFLVGQMALTGCLVYAAGLVVHSQLQAQTLDRGFDANQVLVFWPPDSVRHNTTPTEFRADIAKHNRLVQASLERLNASPAVLVAAEVQALALTGLPGPVERTITHFNGRRLHPLVTVWATGAGRGFLAALGGTMVAGSTFDDPAHAGRHDVAIVNETLAARLSPMVTLLGVPVQAAVIGTAIEADGFQGRIIGVMKDLVDSPALVPRPQIFIPATHPFHQSGIITVNARTPLTSSVPVIRAILEEVWGPVPERRLGLMSSQVERALAPFRTRSALLGLIAAFCLPLAGVGLIGALFQSVRSRERETAIRVALGGEPSTIRREVIFRALFMVGLGLIPGIAMGAALGRLAAHQLFNVHPVDPLAIGLVAGGFLLLGLLAAVIPSRRAARVEPAVLLRSV